MAVAAHASTIKTTGTATALTNEATTEFTANTVFQITDTAKRVLDPTVALTVQQDPLADGSWAAVAATLYTVDYLFGKITFTPALGAAALVRVATGSYLALLTVAPVRAYNWQVANEAIDSTVHGTSGGERTALYGLGDISGSLKVYEDLLTDHDSGAGTVKFTTAVHDKAPILLELRSGGVGELLRAWVIFDDTGLGGSVEDLISATLPWKGAGKSHTNGTAAPYGSGSAS